MKRLILAGAAIAAVPAFALAQTRAPEPRREPTPPPSGAEGYAEAERLNAAVVAANIEAGVRETQQLAAWRAQVAAQNREYQLALARYNGELQAYQRRMAAAQAPDTSTQEQASSAR